MSTLQQALSILDAILAQLRPVYRDFQRVRADCVDLLRASPSLSAQRGQCVRQQAYPNQPHMLELLKITGYIPITHKNVQNDVPIEMWIPETYPFAAPVCKIPVAQALPIKQLHLHADAQGNIYLPYITYWNPNSSNLLGTFTDDFPFVVMQAPALPAAPAPELYASATGPSPMHYYSTPLHYTPQAAASGAPGPTEDSMPLPFVPPRQVGAHPSPSISSAHSSLPSPSVHIPLGALADSHLQNNNFSTLLQYTAPPYSASPPQPLLPAEEEISLMSFQRAYEDPVVLRNNLIKSLTERTQQRLKPFFSSTTKDVEELMETNQALKKKLNEAGNHRLHEALDLASREHNEQQRQLAEVTAWLAANDKGDNIDIDGITEPKDPVYKQLIHVVAEDAAYEDAYYQLEQLLAANKIDLQAFLKTSRAIAREQFMCRALTKKISEKLNERGRK